MGWLRLCFHGDKTIYVQLIQRKINTYISKFVKKTSVREHHVAIVRPTIVMEISVRRREEQRSKHICNECSNIYRRVHVGM